MGLRDFFLKNPNEKRRKVVLKYFNKILDECQHLKQDATFDEPKRKVFLDVTRERLKYYFKDNYFLMILEQIIPSKEAQKEGVNGNYIPYLNHYEEIIKAWSKVLKTKEKNFMEVLNEFDL